MKKIGINLSNLIKEHVLDLVPDPDKLNELREKLYDAIPEGCLDEASDILNEIYVLAVGFGYDVGFETASGLASGNTEVNIVAD